LTRKSRIDSVQTGVGAIISTELFNDFKAQAAIFKSRCSKPGPVYTRPINDQEPAMRTGPTKVKDICPKTKQATI
jgi:hypothetical protein